MDNGSRAGQDSSLNPDYRLRTRAYDALAERAHQVAGQHGKARRRFDGKEVVQIEAARPARCIKR